MRQWLLATLLFTTLVFAAAQRPATPASDMEEICQVLEADCRELPEPIVIISQIVQDLDAKLYGLYYAREPYVFVNPNLPLDKITKVRYHETVHYVLDYISGYQISRCASETAARALTALKFGTEVDPTWEERYGCGDNATKYITRGRM